LTVNAGQIDHAVDVVESCLTLLAGKDKSEHVGK
jgi:hypothetical protein